MWEGIALSGQRYRTPTAQPSRDILMVYLIALGKDRSVASLLFFSGVLAALLFPWKKAFTLQAALLLIPCHDYDLCEGV